MARFLGIDYIWDAPLLERNTEEQIKILNTAVKNGADAILIAASDPLLLSTPIEDAKARGVKIIYVDAIAYEEAITTLATDNVAAGELAAETMLTELMSEGIEAGSIGIINVPAEVITTNNRNEAFRRVITEDGRFRLLNTIHTSGVQVDEQAAADAVIRENPDLVGLFGTNEGTTIAVGKGIKKSNRNIIGIGFDVTEEIKQLIDEGYLKATMEQNPYTMGYLGLAEAIAALNGKKTGPSFINTGIIVRNVYTH